MQPFQCQVQCLESTLGGAQLVEVLLYFLFCLGRGVKLVGFERMVEVPQLRTYPLQGFGVEVIERPDYGG